MTRIAIVLDLFPEESDSTHSTGLTEEAHLGLSNAVAAYGDIVDITKVSDEA